MVEVMEQTDTDIYRVRFERCREALAGREGAWLTSIRQSAMDCFLEQGFPTTKDEEWRYTNVAPIARTPFEWLAPGQAALGFESLEPFLLSEDSCHRLVFINGRFSPDLSCPGLLPDGVTLTSLGDAMAAGSPAVQAHLTRHAKYQTDAFAALNTALMEDGAFIQIAPGKIIEKPVYLLFVSTTDGRPTVSHPRVLIVAGANSQATVIENYVGLGGETYLTNCVTELVAGENAVVNHYKIGQESAGSYHVGVLQIHQERGSNVTSFAITLSEGLTRNDISTLLDGEGGECTLNGLYQAGDGEHVDNHLTVDHASPHCNSREFFKGVLDGRGRGVFSGRIIVRKDAQKTDAKQSNMSLLLSDEAQIESKPQLEILADDVKCTHGATVGQIEPDAIFYLRSRGLTEIEARRLLVYGFAQESVSCISLQPLRERLTELLFERLPYGQALQGIE